MRGPKTPRALSVLLGLNLLAGGVWFGAINWWYIQPRPFLPDNRHLALGLAMALRETNGFLLTSGGSVKAISKSFGICGLGPMREIYYFRALAPWWDFRARLLDWRLSGQAIPWLDWHDWEGWTSWLGSLEENLAGYMARSGSPEDLPVFFLFDDCETALRQSPDFVVRVVAVSPVVVTPYWAADGSEGQVFFLAVELVARVSVWRRVFAVGVQPLGPVASRAGKLEPWIREIPEDYWREEFGRWPRAGWKP